MSIAHDVHSAPAPAHGAHDGARTLSAGWHVVGASRRTTLPTSTGLDSRKLLMWLFLASDCMFFGSLIGTFMVYKGRSIVGPSPQRDLRHPVHLGQRLRAADELADDGAGAGGDPAERSGRGCGSG